jgi:hypothetical protein
MMIALTSRVIGQKHSTVSKEVEEMEITPVIKI